jgi:hypothetical protein
VPRFALASREKSFIDRTKDPQFDYEKTKSFMQVGRRVGSMLLIMKVWQ